MARTSGELDEIDDGRSEYGERNTLASDMVRRNDSVGAGAEQLLLRAFFVGTGDDEQPVVEEAGAHRDEQVVRVGGHERDEAPGAPHAGAFENLYRRNGRQVIPVVMPD